MPDCWAKHEKTKMTLCNSFFVLEGESVNVEVSRAFESILKMRFSKKCRCHCSTIVPITEYVFHMKRKKRILQYNIYVSGMCIFQYYLHLSKVVTIMHFFYSSMYVFAIWHYQLISFEID